MLYSDPNEILNNNVEVKININGYNTICDGNCNYQ